MKLKDILNLFKTEEEIRAAMPLSEVVSVLKQKIIDAHLNNETVIFTITGIKKTGFQVKVKGIFAFVPFSLMPFKYTPALWNVIKQELIGHKFFAKIITADIQNNRITLDATVTEFEEFKIIDGATYKAIILQKNPKFIIVEIGHRYNWQFGSQCFIVTFDSPNYLEIDYYTQSVSDEIDLTYIETANNWIKISFEKKEKETNYFSDFYTLNTLEKKIEIKQNQFIDLEEKITQLKQEIPEKAKVTESKYENLLAFFEKQQKTIEQLKKRNTKLQQNHQKSLNQTLSLIDEKMQLEEKITNLEMHIQHLTSNSKQKNYDKVIEMLENLKAKSNQQKIQITNLEAQLKKEREKKE